jgi:phosphoglycerate dehydrogenase-like enzyme
MAGMDAGLISPDAMTPAVLASPEAAGIKILSRWGVGYDSIDIAAATREGIVIGYTPGFLNETVADYTFALLLSMARRVHEVHALMTAGSWHLLWGVDVFGKTLGLAGCGRIGQAVARRALAFNMRVLAYDVAPQEEAKKMGVQFVSLDQMLSESDFVSIHSALTPQNAGMFGEETLGKMKRGAMLVNTARGALVNEAALARALKEGRLGGAALDVFEKEPLPLDSPLRGAPNVLLSPHQAPLARETGARVSLAAARNILDLMQGRRPAMVVNPQVFDSPALRARLS